MNVHSNIFLAPGYNRGLTPPVIECDSDSCGDPVLRLGLEVCIWPSVEQLREIRAAIDAWLSARDLSGDQP